MNHEAIYKLNPSVVTIRGDVAYDADGNEIAYDKAAVQAYVDAHAERGLSATCLFVFARNIITFRTFLFNQ